MTVFRVWIYRHSRALVCVDADSAKDAQVLAPRLVTESDWETDPVVCDMPLAARKDWPNPDRYWTGDLFQGKWVYPATELFNEGEK